LFTDQSVKLSSFEENYHQTMITTITRSVQNIILLWVYLLK